MSFSLEFHENDENRQFVKIIICFFNTSVIISATGESGYDLLPFKCCYQDFNQYASFIWPMSDNRTNSVQLKGKQKTAQIHRLEINIDKHC